MHRRDAGLPPALPFSRAQSSVLGSAVI